jgi:hypothetical protein
MLSKFKEFFDMTIFYIKITVMTYAAKKLQLIFSHENKSERMVNSKEIISDCDLVIAEVAFPSTGMGIELGWANIFKKRILCVHRADTKPSASLKEVSSEFISYSGKEILVKSLLQFFDTYTTRKNISG